MTPYEKALEAKRELFERTTLALREQALQETPILERSKYRIIDVYYSPHSWLYVVRFPELNHYTCIWLDGDAQQRMEKLDRTLRNAYCTDISAYAFIEHDAEESSAAFLAIQHGSAYPVWSRIINS